MPGKILWLALAVTLTLWLGSIAGCTSTQEDNQNYKTLEDDRPMFETRNDPGQPGADASSEIEDASSPAIVVTDGAGNEVQAVVEVTDGEDNEAEAVVQVEAAVIEPPAVFESETEPSLNGLDRSHWPIQVTQSDDGKAPYQPHYFDDLPLDSSDGPRGNPLDGHVAAGMDKTNTFALVTEPFKFLTDLFLLPVTMTMDPPREQQRRFPGDWSGPINWIDKSEAAPRAPGSPAAEAEPVAEEEAAE